MTMKNLLPSIWNRDTAPAGREEERLFFPLQREMNRIFDDFFRGWNVAPSGLAAGRFGFFQPSIDVKPPFDSGRQGVLRLLSNFEYISYA